ncbi:uncharacterized protein N7496_007571 [Penicillium cataractarum]|uniref:Thioesterase domain-containing protein n=1 Tax=Penicillium cataractarum TaxID=2100454 RepID=A0A9W9S6C8_9EURO|nr:uncharacterized protein N7496_007571 [Penicillium cataractarum]KAJ5371479.1 hypothetical protein N7496_007571 [Penicillium cataractarum]
MSLQPNESVLAANLDYFGSLPCFQRYYQRSNLYHAAHFMSQCKDLRATSNSFFNETIKSPSTIAHAVALFHQDVHTTHPDTVASDRIIGTSINRDDPAFLLFVHVGSGLNGFSGMVHGGVLASLIDESLSICVEKYRAILSKERHALFTGNLNISYHVPVQSPGVVYIRTWLRRREGRKWFLDAELLNKDEQMCVSAKSLWISEKKVTKL